MLTRDDATVSRPRSWRGWLARVGILTAVLGAIWAVGQLGDGRGERAPTARTSATSAPVSGERTVLLEFDGTTTGVDITMSVGGGETSQLTDRAVPVTRTDGTHGIEFQLAPGTWVYWSGQNTEDDGTLMCTITVDGVKFKQSISSGAYVISTCSGRIP